MDDVVSPVDAGHSVDGYYFRCQIPQPMKSGVPAFPPALMTLNTPFEGQRIVYQQPARERLGEGFPQKARRLLHSYAAPCIHCRSRFSSASLHPPFPFELGPEGGAGQFLTGPDPNPAPLPEPHSVRRRGTSVLPRAATRQGLRRQPTLRMLGKRLRWWQAAT